MKYFAKTFLLLQHEDEEVNGDVQNFQVESQNTRRRNQSTKTQFISI